MRETLPKRVMLANAARIAQLDDAFGHLPFDAKSTRTIREHLNLSIPLSHLIEAGLVTRVVDSFDSVNDQAVADVERYSADALALIVAEYGETGWWSEKAAALNVSVAS